MFDKIRSLQRLEQLGLNVHRYYLPETYAEYKEILNQLKLCTIRTDAAYVTNDLPFYVVSLDTSTEQEINFIWTHSMDHGYRLILSDGIKHDEVQEYNLVVRFERNGDFVFDVSELKIPLRHMYRHPLLCCAGNIAEEISEWEILQNHYGIDRRKIKRDLEVLYTYGIYCKWLEVTKYPEDVGVKKEPIVFWQIG